MEVAPEIWKVTETYFEIYWKQIPKTLMEHINDIEEMEYSCAEPYYHDLMRHLKYDASSWKEGLDEGDYGMLPYIYDYNMLIVKLQQAGWKGERVVVS